MKGPARLRPEARIRKAAEFQACRENGSKVFSKHFICQYSRNKFDHPRIGLIVTKKIGPAVIRNRWKRIVRNFFRTHMDEFHQTFDYVFVVKAPNRTKPPKDIPIELAKLIGKIKYG